MQLHYKKYDVSYVQRGAHMNRIKRRQKPSLLEVINKYSNNQNACINFFMQISLIDHKNGTDLKLRPIQKDTGMITKEFLEKA